MSAKREALDAYLAWTAKPNATRPPNHLVDALALAYAEEIDTKDGEREWRGTLTGRDTATGRVVRGSAEAIETP